MDAVRRGNVITKQAAKILFLLSFLLLILTLSNGFVNTEASSFSARVKDEAYERILSFENTLRDIDETQTIEVGDSFSYNLSDAAKGYIVVRSETENEIGCTLDCGDVRFTYLSLPSGETLLPVSMGSGKYTLKVVRLIAGTSYEVLDRVEFDVEFEDEMIPFLIPSYMVPYNANSSFIHQAAKLCDSASKEKTAEKICKWVFSNIKYDYDKSEIIERDEIKLSDSMPDTEKIYEEGKGICLDKAALAAAMLRSAGIPTQIVFGNFEGAWHAWLSTCVKEGEWLLLDPTIGQIGEADTYIPEMNY